MLEPFLALPDVVLQFEPNVNRGGPSLVGAAASAFFTTLIVGAILVTFAPDYTDRMTGKVADNAISSFLYGFLVLIVLVLVGFILAITIIGLLVAIPLLLVAYLVWAIGATIGFMTIGARLVGREDGWVKPLAVGAAINGGLALTGIGGIVSFIIGAIGFGAIINDYRE